MKTSILRSRSWLAGIVATVAVSEVRSEPAHADLLQQAESRFRAIYDREEFRPKRFGGEWLSHSSGYTVSESVPDAKEKVRARYDLGSGQRTVLDPEAKEKPAKAGSISPDGRRAVLAEKGNLYVRELGGDRRLPLTRNVPDGPVSNSQAVWSPDGEWIAFMQTDESDVKLRSELVPGDPSYPEVRQVRFARVGGTIPALRVGVVDAQGKSQADYHRTIADLGYLVVSIDNRGTPAPQGAAWRRAICGSLGPLSTEEQAAALKPLARTRPYVDASRVAIWGWSGGGSNTLNAMFRKPDVYHVGIAVVFEAPAPSLQRLVPGDLHADALNQPGRLPSRGAHRFCRGPEGQPADRSRHRREQHAPADCRRPGGPAHRAGQTVRLHGLSES
jgi:dipeptidyl aminopeptidase/acylaminoacyl peptidase